MMKKYMSLFLAAAHSLEFYYPYWPEHRWVQLLLPRIWQLFLSVVWLKDSWEGRGFYESYKDNHMVACMRVPDKRMREKRKCRFGSRTGRKCAGRLSVRNGTGAK